MFKIGNIKKLFYVNEFGNLDEIAKFLKRQIITDVKEEII